MPGNTHQSEQWSAEAKLATVIATAVLSEAELSHYCREQGLYPEQVRSWRNAALEGFARSAELRGCSSAEAASLILTRTFAYLPFSVIPAKVDIYSFQ